MYMSEAQLLESGNGWYIETNDGSQGPMETQSEASDYLNLLNVVSAARAGTACGEHEFAETEIFF
ncbi:MAG: hypothetical protein OEZ39_03210 [Gammaproteobacteria bacterium]|nr:hypothetical protein [Gammaproteobacteria bacterium]MDH5650864.1 hypothetical protein [Gammaproteobacteria bacterium]